LDIMFHKRVPAKKFGSYRFSEDMVEEVHGGPA
jgi:hypothetical protein